MPTDNHCKAVQEHSATTQQEREAFEAHWKPPAPCNFERRISDNGYCWQYVQAAWEGWQSRASLPNSGEGSADWHLMTALSAKEPKL